MDEYINFKIFIYFSYLIIFVLKNMKEWETFSFSHTGFFFLDWISWKSIRVLSVHIWHNIGWMGKKYHIYIFDKLWVYIYYRNMCFFFICTKTETHICYNNAFYLQSKSWYTLNYRGFEKTVWVFMWISIIYRANKLMNKRVNIFHTECKLTIYQYIMFRWRFFNGI